MAYRLGGIGRLGRAPACGAHPPTWLPMTRPNGYLVIDDEITRILAESARAFNLTPADLTGRSRQHRCVRARHVAMAVIRQTTGMSMPKIGAVLDRDYATVQYALERHRGEPEFEAQVAAVIAELESRFVVRPERREA